MRKVVVSHFLSDISIRARFMTNKKFDLNGSFAVENKSLSTKAASIKGQGSRHGIFGLICVLPNCLRVLAYKEWLNKDGMKFSCLLPGTEKES